MSRPFKTQSRRRRRALLALTGLLCIAPASVSASEAAAGSRAVVKSRKVQPMSLEKFWAVVATTTEHEHDAARQLDALRFTLRKLSTDELLAYEAAFDQVMTDSYSWDLWGAAYVVHGGASDDGFEYFRCWLVSKGRRVFERVLAQPDSLADLLAANLQGVLEFESFAYVAREVWAEKTGKPAGEMPGAAAMLYIGRNPTGKPFEEDEASLAKRYPKLFRRFGAHPLG